MQTLSLGRIFAYPFLQTSPKFKIFVGFIFIFLSEPLNILLEGTGFIYDFFFSQRLWNIPFPFFSFLFMGMAIGDWIYSWRNNTKIIKIPTEKPKIIQAKKLLIIGFCFIIISIIVGYQMIENSVSDFLIYYLNRRSDEATWVYPYTGLPAFMVKNTWQWCIYSLGVQSIILSIFIRKEEIVMQTNQKDNTKFLKSFGRSSLTIYYIQHITFIILLGMFSIQIFIPIIIIYVLMYYYGIRLWTSPNYGKGKYTIEWFINESDAYILKRLNPLFQKWNLGQRNK
ncbi:MAG: hypothetical protein GY870_05970 [archaeon]|nr:hypothetical protein [archaeon]